MRRLCLIGLLVICTGCASLGGSRLADFRAYYNTFYNAQEAFVEATRDLSFRDDAIDPGYFIRLRPGPEELPSAAAFDDVIERSADILRDHPQTRWVDPALMLIGKSYFNQENYAGAEQNFREVVDRGGEHVQEAHAWIARTLLAAGRTQDALDHFELHRAELEGSSRADIDLTAALAFVDRRDWERAARALRRSLDGNLDRTTRARGLYLLGQVAEANEQYTEAAEAFEQAAALRASDEIALASAIGQARALAHADDPAAARELLEWAEGRQRFSGRQPEIRYWRGYVASVQGDLPEAKQVWSDIIEDASVAPSSDVMQRIHHALGILHRDSFQDYTQAAHHFGHAAASAGIEETSRSTPSTKYAIQGSRQQAERFADVAEATERMQHLDSLLTISELDDEEYEAFVADLYEQRLAELQAVRASRDVQDEWTPSAAAGGAERGLVDAADTAGDSGFLFYRDAARVQELRVRFERRWGDRPHVPDWRRREAISAISQIPDIAPDGVMLEDSVGDEIGAGEVDLGLDEVPRDDAGRAEMRRELAEARYRLGNALFLSVERPDSAAYWYRQVIDSDGTEDVRLRSRYALAEVYASMGREDEARDLYRIVARQQDDPALASRAEERLSGRSAASRPANANDDAAARAYEEAYAVWEGGASGAALERMLDLYEEYPASQIAPQALFAAGHMALNTARNGASFGPTARARMRDPVNDDSMAASSSAAMDLAEMLWDELQDRFPSAPHASRAAHIMRALTESEQRPQIADRATGAAADSIGEEIEEMPAPTEVRAGEPVRIAPELANEVNLDPASDGWTIVVGSEPDEAAAAAEARSWNERGYRAAVLRAESGRTTHYRIALGQAATRDRAAQLLRQHADDLPGDSWLLQTRADIHVAHVADTPDAHTPDEAPGQPEDALPDEPRALPAELGGEEPIDRGAGGWTIVVGSEAAEAAAVAEAQSWNERGYRATVLPSDGAAETRYRIAIGQAATYDRAQNLLAQHRSSLPDDSWVLLMTVDDQIAHTEPVRESEWEEPEEPVLLDTTPANEPERLPSELAGTTPVDPAAGGWTIIIASAPDEFSALAEAGSWAQAGYRTRVLPVMANGEIRYRIAIGQVATRERAEEILDQHSDHFPADSWLLNFSSQRN